MVEVPSPSITAWEANPKQALFIQCEADEVFFGGARGGGKSNATVADFYHHEQLYGGSARGILFRRTFQEFTHLREMADQMLDAIAEWDAENGRYVWPSGAWLQLGYLEHDRHLSRYMGQQYTWQGWDELTEWASSKYYLFLRGSLRSTDPDVRLRVVGTGNPGRQGHGWVKQRFVDRAPEGGKLIYDADLQITRMFIPSFVWDNPQIFENQPRYIQNLRSMSHDSQLVKAMLFGDWDVFVGQAFPEFSMDRHVISLADAGIKPHWQRFCSVDFATTKPYAILYFAIDPDCGRVYCYNEDYGCQPGMYDVGTGEDAYTVAKRAFTWSNAYGGGVTQAFFDRAMKANQGAGASVADLFVRAGWSLLEANKDRIEGRRAVHRLLQTDLRDGYPMLQFTDNCVHTIRTLPTLVNNTRIAGKEEDVDDQSEDHLYDALRYFAISHHMMPGAPRFHVATPHRPDGLGEWNPMADYYAGNGTYGRIAA